MAYSVDYRILEVVKSKIDAAGIYPTVHIRKNMAVLETDTFPCIIIGYPYGETISNFIFGSVTDIYQVGVARVDANNRNFTASINSDLTNRFNLKDTLTGVKLTGVDEVWDTDIDPGPPIKIPVSGDAANYQISTFRVSYKANRTYTTT